MTTQVCIYLAFLLLGIAYGLPQHQLNHDLRYYPMDNSPYRSDLRTLNFLKNHLHAHLQGQPLFHHKEHLYSKLPTSHIFEIISGLAKQSVPLIKTLLGSALVFNSASQNGNHGNYVNHAYHAQNGYHAQNAYHGQNGYQVNPAQHAYHAQNSYHAQNGYQVNHAHAHVIPAIPVDPIVDHGPTWNLHQYQESVAQWNRRRAQQEPRYNNDPKQCDENSDPNPFYQPPKSGSLNRMHKNRPSTENNFPRPGSEPDPKPNPNFVVETIPIPLIPIPINEKPEVDVPESGSEPDNSDPDFVIPIPLIPFPFDENPDVDENPEVDVHEGSETGSEPDNSDPNFVVETIPVPLIPITIDENPEVNVPEGGSEPDHSIDQTPPKPELVLHRLGSRPGNSDPHVIVRTVPLRFISHPVGQNSQVNLPRPGSEQYSDPNATGSTGSVPRFSDSVPYSHLLRSKVSVKTPYYSYNYDPGNYWRPNKYSK